MERQQEQYTNRLGAEKFLVDQVTQYKQSSAMLAKEGFKAETVLKMMNNCSDRCELTYHESGIQDASAPGVECFKNCLTKAYKLGSGSLE